MPYPKKWVLVFSFVTVSLTIWLSLPFLLFTTKAPMPPTPHEQIMEMIDTGQLNPEDLRAELERQTKFEEEQLDQRARHKVGVGNPNAFHPGTVKQIGETYTKMIIMPRTTGEDVSWVAENFGKRENFRLAIYTVDDAEVELHPPRNKGHEVMVYLSAIIDNYNNVSDTNIFIHAHRLSRHNNDFHDLETVQMLSRLSSERVQRESYLNLRCH